MTTGIYSLYWEEQDLIYIGQSQNIEKRFKEHIYDLSKNKHSNYKVQNAFHKYGNPILNILEKCSINYLNELEIYWQNEFNSLDSLDLVIAGQVGYGTDSNNSKYSKLKILRVFRLLTRTNSLNYKSISKIIQVNRSLVVDIANSTAHLWLKDKYPKLYYKMQTHDRCSSGNSILNNYTVLPKVVSPLKEIITVYNIRKFAIEHNLHNTHLGEVIRGNRKSHKGWKLYSEPKY